MKLRATFVCLVVSFLVLVHVSSSNAASISHPIISGGHIILEETSTITITSWLGKTSCQHGEVLLLNPGDLKVVSKNFDVKQTTLVPVSNGRLLIPDYGDGRAKITIGPYGPGTELKLALNPGAFCHGSYLSTDKLRTRFKHNGGNSWTIAWEDYKDFDLNDVYTEITIQPVGNTITDSVGGVQVFSENPTYKLPWPSGVGHKLTSYPGYAGEHHDIDAYDFAMRDGDLIVASEQGLVLWVEDSFGPGGCNPKLRNRVNVVVIQTEEGIHQTYAHLKKGSAKEFGIEAGQVVTQGQPIGRAGNSGYSCSRSGGPATHLHIEWQHHCYDLDSVGKRRPKEGTPTLAWSCAGFSPESPYQFTYQGKVGRINNLYKEFISDNSTRP